MLSPAEFTEYINSTIKDMFGDQVFEIKDGLFVSKVKKISMEKTNIRLEIKSDSSLRNLEESLVSAIYEQINKNPTLNHKDHRNLKGVRKKRIKLRDKNICLMCQKEFSKEELEVDHIYPWALGGSHLDANLMAVRKS